MFKLSGGTSKQKPKLVSTKKDNKQPKYKAYHRVGSPIVKSVYNYKTKVPASVSTSAGVSEWSPGGTFMPGEFYWLQFIRVSDQTSFRN